MTFVIKLFTSVYFASLIVAIIVTNVKPIHYNENNDHDRIENDEISFNQKDNSQYFEFNHRSCRSIKDHDKIENDEISSNQKDNPQDLYISDYIMISNQIIIALLTILGNLLTLCALPYVKWKYGSQFTILKFNSVTLLLHLSLCDLLYGLIGFPHFFHAYLYKTPESYVTEEVCYVLGMVRNMIAYADFNTIAVISCCVARQTLCRQCEQSPMTHDDHDKIFGGRRIYLVCLGTWLVSALLQLPNSSGRTGTFAWTHAYGCDPVPFDNTCFNIGPFLNNIINLCAIMCFYSATVFKMIMNRNRIHDRGREDYDSNIISISKTLLILTLAYWVFLLPTDVYDLLHFQDIYVTCVRSSKSSILSRKIIASWYWWLFGINFLVYLVFTPRIRAAYKKFLEDLWSVSTSQGRNVTRTEESSCWGARTNDIVAENEL